MTTTANTISAAVSWRAPWLQKATAASAKTSAIAGVVPHSPKE